MVNRQQEIAPKGTERRTTEQELMARGDAERIRLYLCGQVDSARRRGDKTITFRAGDIHKALGFANRMPNVCQVLKSTLFHEVCRVDPLRRIYSPPSGQGARLEIEFRIL